MVRQAHTIIDEAVAEHRPSKVFALFSGGNDSLVNTYVTSLHPAFSGVVHIDTGTGIRPSKGTGMLSARDFVRDTCNEYGWPLAVFRTPNRYADSVRKQGFPGPAGHMYMYRRLKDRCIDALVRQTKRGRMDRIMLCTGARLSESQRRMGTVQEVRRRGAQVWVNPILHWNKTELLAYRTEVGLPVNPMSERLGMSGECLCGAFAKPGELARIESISAVNARYIRILQAEAHRCGHHWNWEERPPRSRHDARSDIVGAIDFQPLCASCNIRHELAQEVPA
jgi:3'-phosphoadenosine 5'-phosphosulfate sulfotransferase (PAPS reductase)/FAD synthetase